MQTEAEKAVATAQADALRAEEALADARKALDSLNGGLGADLLEKDLAVALAALEEAKERLAEVLAPGELEVEAARGQETVAQATLDRAEQDLADLLVRAGSLEAALLEAAVASAQAALEGSLRRFETSTLKAPWDGLATVVHVEAGEEVSATTPIVEVVDPGFVEVDGAVDEIDVLSVRRGAQAMVTMDALPNEVLRGTVSTLGSAATNQQGVVTYDIAIRVTVPNGLRLQEGLSAVANVVLGRESGLLIPNQALRGSFNDPQVLVMNGSALEERSVALGSSDDFWTVVREGLVEGEEIVVEVQESGAAQFTGFGGGGFRPPGGGGFRPPGDGARGGR